MDDPLEVINDLLRERHGIKQAKLHPSSRLWHDLGVDGDDISDLLQHLHERFGTDFSALNEHWTEFFHEEGASLRSILFALLMMIPSTAVTLWIAAVFKLSTGFAGAIGVAMFFAFWIALAWLFPGKPKRPVTIAGLSNVIRAGEWPNDPAKVR